MDGILTGAPPSSDNVAGETPSTKTTVGLLLSARQFNLTISGSYKPRGHGRLVLNSPVKPMKWNHPPTDASIPCLDYVQSIIDLCNPFNQRDNYVTNMHELYHTNLRIPVVALSEVYSIPFPDYLDKNSYQHVAKDGMYIRNHDFNKTIELVWLDF